MTSTLPGQYDATVASIRDIAPDIRILGIALKNGLLLDFRAGQYAFLEAGGLEPRAFSIASAPGEALLEFHVRNAGSGMSAHVVNALHEGARLTLKGPFGANVLKDGDTPVLLIAGGIGIAPMKSMVEARLKGEGRAPLHLYWGVREAGQLYLGPLFESLAREHPHFHYTPVVAAGAGGRSGFPGQAAAEDLADLSGFDIYMAGPKAMIDATMPLLLQKGALKERIFSDAFSA
jgi:CDP-4-dehydro-6-deoxyglucose reductase/ferredoxin-NAD(P)+ reductase (naphthalene dioxygenase ferredoxin-specific)